MKLRDERAQFNEKINSLPFMLILILIHEKVFSNPIKATHFANVFRCCRLFESHFVICKVLHCLWDLGPKKSCEYFCMFSHVFLLRRIRDEKGKRSAENNVRYSPKFKFLRQITQQRVNEFHFLWSFFLLNFWRKDEEVESLKKITVSKCAGRADEISSYWRFN